MKVVGTVTCWRLPAGQAPGGRASSAEEASVAIAWARYYRDTTLSAAERDALALTLWSSKPNVPTNTWISVIAECDGGPSERSLLLTDAFAELVRTIDITQPYVPTGPQTCPTCNGTGTELLVFLKNPCRTCNATGRIP